MPEMILARVLRCRFCDGEMTCAPLTYEQNPFCAVCLPTRMAAAARVDVQWRREGSYFIAEDAGTLSSDDREHPSR
jgi:hypothetical protein